MSVQSLTLNIPEELYHRIKERADQTQRSVEDETLDLLATVVPVVDELPADLAEAISPLALLDDEALVRAVQSRLPADTSGQLEELHLKRQRAGLTADEEQTLALLTRQYERAMLVRAH